MKQEVTSIRASVRTPRAGAIAGILFSVLLITAFSLLRLSVPADPLEAGMWLKSSSNTVALALNLVPFAGIAFLWFIGVLRDRLGEREDRFFATIFLGSGLLFLAMLFASAAVAGATLRMGGAGPGMRIDSVLYTFGRTVTYELMNVYALRMAAVFMISTCMLSLRTGIVPRWMAYVGMLLALFLLFSLGSFDWAPLVFPLWVLLISVHLLLANLGRSRSQ